MLQIHVGHRTIPCFLHRLTGIHSIGVTLTDMRWSQDRSFSPQVHWNWCTLQTHDDHKTIPCFLHRLTAVGVTDTHWSQPQDHSLFSPQADCVYICVCFETKWSGDFICPTGGVLTNVSVVCMVSSYLLGIVLCLLVRL